MNNNRAQATAFAEKLYGEIETIAREHNLPLEPFRSGVVDAFVKYNEFCEQMEHEEAVSEVAAALAEMSRERRVTPDKRSPWAAHNVAARATDAA
jgi:hypothetical protein